MSSVKQPDSKVRWWDILAAILILTCLFIASMRLLATRWTEHLGMIQTIALFGCILGLALGQSIFSRRVSIFFALAYGIIVVPWELGLTMEKGIEWLERLESLQGRLAVILKALVARESVTDSLLFLLAMSVLFWALSVHAGYVVTRQANPWKAVLPTGVAIFVIHAFDPLLTRRSWYLAFYLFFALLLVARLVYLQKRYYWKQAHAHTPSDVGFDFSRFAVAAAMVLIFLAWNIPVLADSISPVSNAWSAVNRPWQSLKDRFGFAFASLRASVGMVTTMYGDSMLLGTGTYLSDHVVMEVEIPEIPMSGTRFYWRGRVYDQYEDGIWENSFNEDLGLTVDSLDLSIPGADSRQNIDLSVTVYDPLSLLYMAAQPVWVSRPSTASVINNPDGTVDLGAVIVNDYIRPGERYAARSALTSTSIKELREAGTDYPTWVVDRYLDLPNNITPRTHELAQRISAGKETPYDIAQAVTDYLRINITYKTTIPPAPSGQERIDWFLFDLQEGYCNYYASAQVILLRSLGIPARLSVGFAQGERVIPIIPAGDAESTIQIPDEKQISYVIRQLDAHAWPEVFFPGIGWVEFEPTTSQDTLIRPLGEELPDTQSENLPDEQIDDLTGQIPDDDFLTGLDRPEGTSQPLGFWTPTSISLSIILIVTLALLIVFIWRVRHGFRLSPVLERLGTDIPIRLEQGMIRLGITPPRFLSRWAYYMQLPSLSRSYLEVNRALNRLGQYPEVNKTPAERVDHLEVILPVAKDPAHQLLNEYQSSIYSIHPADEAIAYQAGKEVRKLSLLASWRKWFARFQEPASKSPHK